jgi:hypothetical protein
VAGMQQSYTCTQCGYGGTAPAAVNASEEMLLEAARSDHAEHSPDCQNPDIKLGSMSSSG